MFGIIFDKVHCSILPHKIARRYYFDKSSIILLLSVFVYLSIIIQRVRHTFGGTVSCIITD